MSVRAVVQITNIDDNGYRDGRLAIEYQGVIIGTNWGDFETPTFMSTMDGANPNSLTLINDLQASVKTYLIAFNVPFGLLDTVKYL